MQCFLLVIHNLKFGNPDSLRFLLLLKLNLFKLLSEPLILILSISKQNLKLFFALRADERVLTLSCGRYSALQRSNDRAKLGVKLVIKRLNLLIQLTEQAIYSLVLSWIRRLTMYCDSSHGGFKIL